MKQSKFNVDVLGSSYSVYYVKNDVNLADNLILKLLESNDEILGIDFETECFPQYKHIPKAATYVHYSRPRLLQIATRKSVVVFDFKFLGQGHYSLFKKLLTYKKFVAHYAVFELMFLRQMGFKYVDIDCTLLMTKIILHAVKAVDMGVGLGLEALSKYFLNYEMNKDSQKSDWSVLDLTFEQVKYAAIDAIATLLLHAKLKQGIINHNLTKYYKLIRKAQIPIVTMQYSGVGFNTNEHNELLHKWRNDLYSAQKLVKEATGLDSITTDKISKWLESSLPSEVLKIWPRTDTDKLKTDSHTFSDFDYLPIVKPFSALQKAKKLTTGYGSALAAQVSENTKRIHPSFTLVGARTGRMSCNRPNLQQAPNDYYFRKLFTPREGYVFYSADYSQIELRVLAELARDDVMLKAFKEGKDIHRLTASRVSGKPMEDITDAERKAGKGFNFGLVFGMGANTYVHYAKKSYGAKVTVDQAERDIQKWRDLYDEIFYWQMDQASNARETFRATTPYGKVRKLAPDNTFGASMNTPVQGGAAEVMMLALILIDKELDDRGLDAKLVNCVHDEVVVEGKQKDGRILKPVIQTCMVKAFAHIFPGAVLNGVVDEVGMGANWAQASGKKPY